MNESAPGVVCIGENSHGTTRLGGSTVGANEGDELRSLRRAIDKLQGSARRVVTRKVHHTARTSARVTLKETSPLAAVKPVNDS